MGKEVLSMVEEHARSRFLKYGSEEFADEMLQDFKESYPELLKPINVEAGACIVALYDFGLWPEAMFDDNIDLARREMKRAKDLFLNKIEGTPNLSIRYMSYIYSVQSLLKREFTTEELSYLDSEINNSGFTALGDLAADIYNMLSSRERLVHIETLSKTSGNAEEGIRRRAELRKDLTAKKKVLNSPQR